jgi:16S rRNA (cytidine1402-2'-O)-methyltransferase
LSTGTLYVVGTPIGNLEDLSQRALRILREVDLIAAEDTRHTRGLLTHFDIRTPLFAYHEHNARTAGPALLERLQAGGSVALVTDAGMPGISDPGAHLVALARAAAVPVVVVPGPTAVTTALVGSGLPTDRFVFEGFIPRSGKERKQRLQEIARETRTVVIYEAPHRVLDTLADLQEVLGDRVIVAARELTKTYEEYRRGTAADLHAHFTATPPRGEFTLVIAGADPSQVQPETPPTHENLVQAVARWEAQGLDRKEAMRKVAAERGISRRDVYQALLAEKQA